MVRCPLPPTNIQKLFVRINDNIQATELTRGPWSHGVMHGGPICGLLAWVIENRLGRDDLVCSRLTGNTLRVPVEVLETSSDIIKNGKRTAVVQSSISQHGKVLARATSQWLSPPERLHTNSESVAEIPSERANPGAHPDVDYPRPGFNARRSICG